MDQKYNYSKLYYYIKVNFKKLAQKINSPFCSSALLDQNFLKKYDAIPIKGSLVK